jgi:hypothetical protein
MTIIAIGMVCKDINIIFLIQHLFGITWISHIGLQLQMALK